jgi:hypothetical protein
LTAAEKSGLDEDEMIFISGLLWDLRGGDCLLFFDGGDGSSSSEELELDEFTLSSSESNINARAFR